VKKLTTRFQPPKINPGWTIFIGVSLETSSGGGPMGALLSRVMLGAGIAALVMLHGATIAHAQSGTQTQGPFDACPSLE